MGEETDSVSPSPGELSSILRRAASVALVVNVLGAAAGFVTHLVLANLLGTDAFGDYAYVLGWVNVLTLFTTVGLDTVAVRFIPIYLADDHLGLLRGLLRRSYQIVAVASVIGATGLWAGATLLRPADSGTLVATFAAGAALLVILSLLRITAAQVQATRRIGRAHGPIFVVRPAAIAVATAIFAMVAELSAPVAMVVNAGCTLLALAMSSLFLRSALPARIRTERPRYESHKWRHALIAFVFYAGFIYLMQRVDILMVGALRSTREAGLYSVASQVAALVVFGLHAVSAIAAPMISELHDEGQPGKLQKLLRLAGAGSLAVGLLGSIGLFLVGRLVLSFFGDDFVGAYGSLCILGLGFVPYAAFGLSHVVLNMTNHHRPVALFAGIALLLNIALNAVLVPRSGIEGAALATAISTLVSNLLAALYTLRGVGLNPSALPLAWLIPARLREPSA